MFIKLVFLFISLSCILAEQDYYVNTEKIISNMDLIHRVVDPLEILPIRRTHIYRKNKLNFNKTKYFSLLTSDINWNNDFINSTNKLRKLDIDVEAGKNEETMVIFNRYDEFDLQLPAIISVEWYKEESLRRNLEISIVSHFKTELLRESQVSSGKSLQIFNQEVAGTEVKLNIDGELTIEGDVNFQDREIISMNQTESSNWDLDIEQTQKFGIDGTIGDRIFVEINQDSEATFSWDNDLSIEYKGKENDILKSAQGGNISLSLPSSQFVSVGSGKNEGLFGIKLAHSIGPLTINTILSREQVKKSQSSFLGGESSGENEIFDYNFIRGVYFFIDKKFKNQFYPLDINGNHYIDNNYVIDSIIVYKTVSQYDVNVKSNVEAYLDPSDTTKYSQKGGLWVKMDDKIDYEINRKEGWIRLNSVGSDEAVAIAYTLGRFEENNPDVHIGIDTLLTYTDINAVSDDFCLVEGWELGDSCGDEVEGVDYQEFNGEEGFQPPAVLKLKLIKDTYLQGQLQPTSPTWELMFKNVYSLGSGSIDPSSLEIEIVHDKGAELIHTHNPESGLSYSNIFGIDTEDGNYNYVQGGDGKIDIKPTIIDDVRGELFLPFHLPFSYDNIGRIDSLGNIDTSILGDTLYWGNSSVELEDIIDPLNDPNNNCCYDSEVEDTGPDMYYANSSNASYVKEFIIRTKFASASRSSIIKLDGFMIVPNSETVTLNGTILTKGVDYTINYDSGTVDFSNQQATDPTANLVITYEENEIISFDQKLLAGTHLKYDINDYSFLSGGLYYYNQSIVNDKVNVGSEPMRNFIWNIAGTYKQDAELLTKLVNMIPLIETSKSSSFSIEGEYAEVYPNPNPLGQAFIDDFESSKRTTSPNILSRQWKKASMPDDEEIDFDKYERSHMSWYNPYNDILTKNIWPNQETSSRANNERTKTLWLETFFSDTTSDVINWNGITTTLFDYNQSRSKYIDIWVNYDEVDTLDFKLHIDIGQISEDHDGDGKFDSEDQAVYTGGVGNKRFDEGEDTGLDGCFDEYETGYGYSDFDNPGYSHCLSGIYSFMDLCKNNIPDVDPEEFISMDRCDELLEDEDIDLEDWDPNGDNFIYVEGVENYEFSNGTEGNAIAYPYLDTEDLNKSEPYYSLDILNDYFSKTLDFESLYMDGYIESESDNGWKLIRIPLSHFEPKGKGNVDWEYVQNMRLWVESKSQLYNKLKIAKIEIVGNEWEELGTTRINEVYDYDSFIADSSFKVEVINTDENSEYKKPEGVTQEVDEYTGLTLREQSLVIAFDDYEGISDSSVIAIKKTLNQLSSQNDRNSFLAYEQMNMYVFGGDPSEPEALYNGETDIELLFRFGKDENYYEISQNIYQEWDDRNAVNIDIESLNQLKIPLQNNPGEELSDVGIDGCSNEFEDGFGSCLDSLTFKDWCSEISDFINTDGTISDFSGPINVDRCISLIPDMDFEDSNQSIVWDPNWDDFIDFNGDGIWDEGEIGEENNNKFDFIDTNNNGLWDIGEIGEPAVEDYDGNNVWSNLGEYDIENDLFYFKENINHICGHCNELRIKGSPAINNLEYVIVGVINKSGAPKKGKILIDELRMTGVKKEKGSAFRLTGSVNFADLLSVTSSYTKKDADFHLLQQRLGLGQNEESYSINIISAPEKFLPSNWGIKIPLTINYSHTLLSPKLIQGTDILAGDIYEADKKVQSIDDKITLSTQFSKSTRSRNWFNKLTLDNIILRFSIINSRKSTSTIEKEEYFDYEYFGSYHYKFNKDNYINLFENFGSFVPFVGEILSATRLYYSPDEFSTSVKLEEFDKINIQRANPENPTLTYNLNMVREYELIYKLTNSVTTRYKRVLSSNYDEYKDNKFDFIKDFEPGLIKSVSETFTNSYSPSTYFKWLSPKITYNPQYTWTLVNAGDDISTADITSRAPFSLDFKLKLKDLIKKVYSPTKDNSKLVKYTLGNLYSFSSLFSNGISVSYDNVRNNNYDDISASDKQDYWYRFGLMKKTSGAFNYGSNYESSNTIDNTFTISTTLKLTNKYIINGIKHLRSSQYINNSNQSDQNITFKKTQFPLGMTGDEGFPFFDWNINWSMLDNDFLRRYFKIMTFRNSHSTIKTEQWQGPGKCLDSNGSTLAFETCNNLQTWTYTQDFNPLLGFEFKTVGADFWEFDVSIIKTLSISNATNSSSPTSRTYTNTITFDLSHFRKGGISIPIPLLEDIYFDNDIRFVFDSEYSHTYKIIDPGNAKSLEDFIEETSLRTINLEPKIIYNFTDWVNGYVKFTYKLTDDKIQGRTELKDIGFYLEFKIRG